MIMIQEMDRCGHTIIRFNSMDNSMNHVDARFDRRLEQAAI